MRHGMTGPPPERPPPQPVPPSRRWAAAVAVLAAGEAGGVTAMWLRGSCTRHRLAESMQLRGVTGIDNSLFDVVAAAWLRSAVLIGVALWALRAGSGAAADREPLIIQESGAPAAAAPQPAASKARMALHGMVHFSAMLLAGKLVAYDNWGSCTAGGALIATSFAVAFAEAVLLPRILGGERKEWIRFPVLWRILRPYFLPHGACNMVRAVATWVILVASKAANIVAPLLLGEAVSKLSHKEHPQRPYTELALYTALALGSKLLKELQGVIYIYVKQTAYIQMCETTFRHLHGLSLEWHVKKKMGNVMRSMDRGTQAADNMVQYLFLYMLPTILECIVTFVIFYVHFKQPALAGCCLLAFLLYIYLTCAMTAWRRKFREGMNRHDNDYHDRATDSLINFETVKYFTAEDYEIEQFMDSVARYQKYSVKTQATLSLLNGSQQVLVYGCLVAGMVIAAQAVLDPGSDFHVGNFVSVQVYILQLFTPLSFLGTIYNTVVMAFINMQNLADLLAESPDVCDLPGAPPLSLPPGCGSEGGVGIEFDAVRFRYPAQGESRGLQDITFSVPAGSKLAIVGPTGSGKTTLSRLLFRFYDVTGGRVLVNGQDVRRVQQRSLRRAIGIVPQDTVLFNDTLRYNVQYGNPAASAQAVEHAAARAQLSDFIAALPEGWDTKVGERGLKLSGGEKQRVAIARCLLKNPPVIVLDEATSSLDTQTEAQILKVLRCLGGRTVIAIAHRLSTILDADSILVLKHGRVVEQGTHQLLRARGGVYDEMWREQESEAAAGAGAPPEAAR